MSLMTTYTGRSVDPLALTINDIDIRDIAHALACTNRFGGHAKEPYSVAQHSLLVSNLVPQVGLLPIQGLLHDAGEAYLGDLTSCAKHRAEMRAYAEAEDRARRVIFTWAGLHLELNDRVRAADKLALEREMASLLNPRHKNPWNGPLVVPEPWFVVRETFLLRYRALTEGKWKTSPPAA